LTNFDNVTVGIADVAAGLAVFGLRLGDKFGPAAFPKLITRVDIGNPDIHEAADQIRVGGNAEDCLWFVGRRTAPGIDEEPRVRDLEVSRRAFAVAAAQNAAPKNGFVKSQRPLDVGDGEKVRDI
jgi:hypothetical protein